MAHKAFEQHLFYGLRLGYDFTDNFEAEGVLNYRTHQVHQRLRQMLMHGPIVWICSIIFIPDLKN